MSDDKSKQGRDRKEIALGEDYEVKYWTEKLGISRERLEEVVRQVGSSADAVEKHVRASKTNGDDKRR